jgi:hypothetical protein
LRGDPETPSAEVDLLALTRQIDLAAVPELANPFAQRFQVVVGVVGIVMEEQQTTRAREAGEVGDVLGARMTEPGPARILLLGVLAIVDQHVGSAGDLEPRDPFGRHGREIDRQCRLVVGEVGEAASRRPRCGSRPSVLGG